MPAFLLLTLSAEPPFLYRQPLLEMVKQRAPSWDALDVDAFSDEMLVGHAARLVREAGEVVAVFKVLEADAPLRACQPVVEEILQREKPTGVFLLGSHKRLTAIFKARPGIFLQQAASGEEQQQQVAAYLRRAAELE
ncbi:MAG: hypothetical protein ACO1O1_12275 [Adhaeribacter sp.]